MPSDETASLPEAPTGAPGGAPPFPVRDHAVTLMDAMRAVLAMIDDLEALRAENRQLKEALEGRALIERAKGILMARRGCDEATAFRILVALSRKQHRKVRAVAADFAEGVGAGGVDAGVHPLT
ncbi:ANTAR domain-containing response regulator [Streptomyces sp. R35]|uniref:ANTAR domain-containing response regulator n=1 Tax=Streptomyces sp. R35 TaxID=3238630 RepID=A0AB39SG26_9ACTN